MKFENPIMKISIFEVTDVVTASGKGEQTTPLTGQAQAVKALNAAGVKSTIEFTF